MTANEPINGALVAMELAKGAIGWVGGQAFSSLFGKKYDFKSIIEKIILEFSQILKNAITENAIRETLTQLASLQANMSHYQNAPNKSRLDDATSQAQDAVALLLSLELNGHHGYLIAIGLQISILQERAKKNQRELLNIVDVIDKAESQLKYIHQKWFDWNRNKFSPQKKHFQITSSPAPIDTYYYFLEGYQITNSYFRNGHSSYSGRSGQEQATLDYQNHIELEKEKIMEAYINDSKEILKKWIELRAIIQGKK